MNVAPTPGSSYPLCRWGGASASSPLPSVVTPTPSVALPAPLIRLSRESGNPAAGDSNGSPVKPGMTAAKSFPGAINIWGRHEVPALAPKKWTQEGT